jgi:SIR2-like domain
MLGPENWRKLAESILAGECTPFLGAGACAPTLPTGNELSQALARQFEYPLVNSTELAHVTQFIAIKSRDSLRPKQEILNRIAACGYPRFEGDEPHHVLASWPVPVYLTTNYDDFMVKALEVNNRTARRDFCRWNTELAEHPGVWQREPGYQPTPQTPIVYHMHGSSELPKSLVATEDDYLEFVYNIARSGSVTKTVDRSWEMLPPWIMRSISNHCLMFVGYSLLDWSFRVIFRWLVLSLRQTQTRLKIAVQLSPFADQATNERAQDYLREYFHQIFDVTVFWGDAQQFIAEVQRHVAEVRVLQAQQQGAQAPVHAAETTAAAMQV